MNRDTSNLVKKKQDEENTSSARGQEQSNSDAKSKGLQYVENNTAAKPYGYQEEQQVDWRQMRSQIQAQAKNSQNIAQGSYLLNLNRYADIQFTIGRIMK